MVIASANGRVNRIPSISAKLCKTGDIAWAGCRAGNAFTPDSSRCLNYPSNLICHGRCNVEAGAAGLSAGLAAQKADGLQFDGSRAWKGG
jgi:hypothetical protein